MRGVLFTQREANFGIIDQQVNKELLTPYNQNSNHIRCKYNYGFLYQLTAYFMLAKLTNK